VSKTTLSRATACSALGRFPSNSARLRSRRRLTAQLFVERLQPRFAAAPRTRQSRHRSRCTQTLVSTDVFQFPGSVLFSRTKGGQPRFYLQSPAECTRGECPRMSFSARPCLSRLCAVLCEESRIHGEPCRLIHDAALGIVRNTPCSPPRHGGASHPLRSQIRRGSLPATRSPRLFRKAPLPIRPIPGLAEDNHSFAALSVFRSDDYNMVGRGRARPRFHIHMISAEFSSACLQQVASGRAFRRP